MEKYRDKIKYLDRLTIVSDVVKKETKDKDISKSQKRLLLNIEIEFLSIIESIRNDIRR